MSLSQDRALRLGVNDQPRLADETLYGNGTASSFQLAHYPIVSASPATAPAILVAGGAGWTATGATVSFLFGTVTFSGIISANSSFRASYHWATFSDEEISYYTGLYPGDLTSQKLRVVEDLMMDAYKRHSWGAAGGQNVNEDSLFGKLEKMREMLQRKLTTEQDADGRFISWADEQENFEAPYT
jgi:hypothetical protein